MGEVIEKAQPEKLYLNQLFLSTQSSQPIENNESVIYDTELENTLQNMKKKNGFFQTCAYKERGWMWNGYPGKILRGTEVKINENKCNKTPDIQKLLVDSSYNTAKSMNDMDKINSRDVLQKTEYYNRKPTEGRISSRDRYIKNNLDNDIRRILNLDTKLYGRGIEKNIIPSNIIDIYTRLEILLGLKLSGHTDTLTEASNLIDELYKMGEIQNEQQYRNAPNKFQT